MILRKIIVLNNFEFDRLRNIVNEYKFSMFYTPCFKRFISSITYVAQIIIFAYNAIYM